MSTDDQNKITNDTLQEEDLFITFRNYFEQLHFQIDDFGGHEYAMREIPTELYGCDNAKTMFMDILGHSFVISSEEKIK